MKRDLIILYPLSITIEDGKLLEIRHAVNKGEVNLMVEEDFPLYDSLVDAANYAFGNFIRAKYPNAKRFGNNYPNAKCSHCADSVEKDQVIYWIRSVGVFCEDCYLNN